MLVQFFLVLVVGVFCVAFGLYEKLIDSCLHFFKNIYKNITFLLPIILGALVSIFVFSNFLQIAFNNFYILTSYAFIGLILGSLPIVFRQAEVSKINIYHIICFILSFVFSVYLIILEKYTLHSFTDFSTSYLILSGFLMFADIVITGVSKSVILMMLRVYSIYLSAIASLNFTILIPLGIGLVMGCVIFMYIINFLFSRFKSYTYFLILGFVMGSLLVIFPGFTFSFEYVMGILVSGLCFFITYKLGKINNKN